MYDIPALALQVSLAAQCKATELVLYSQYDSSKKMIVVFQESDAAKSIKGITNLITKVIEMNQILKIEIRWELVKPKNLYIISVTHKEKGLVEGTMRIVAINYQGALDQLTNDFKNHDFKLIDVFNQTTLQEWSEQLN